MFHMKHILTYPIFVSHETFLHIFTLLSVPRETIQIIIISITPVRMKVVHMKHFH